MNEPSGVEWCAFDAFTPRDLYDWLRIRSEVFVVEQRCVFLDLDGHDHDDGAEHGLIRHDGRIVAGIRVYPHDGALKVSRVVTATGVRGRGLGGVLLASVIERYGARLLVLDAQSQLEDFYANFGFAVCGERFVEDDILHTPMRRDSVPQPD